MSTTVKELATKLNISRAGVEMRMSHIPDFRLKYTRKQGNTLIISDEGGKVLLKGNQHGYSTANSQDLANRYKLIVSKVRSLHKMLDSANADKKSLEASQKRMEELLDQQQKLQLSTQNQNDKLRNRLKKIGGPSVSVKPGKTVNSKPHRKKEGFWSRFFS